MKKTSHMGEVTRTVKGSGAGKGKEPKTLSFVAWETFSEPLNESKRHVFCSMSSKVNSRAVNEDIKSGHGINHLSSNSHHVVSNAHVPHFQAFLGVESRHLPGKNPPTESDRLYRLLQPKKRHPGPRGHDDSWPHWDCNHSPLLPRSHHGQYHVSVAVI